VATVAGEPISSSSARSSAGPVGCSGRVPPRACKRAMLSTDGTTGRRSISLRYRAARSAVSANSSLTNTFPEKRYRFYASESVHKGMPFDWTGAHADWSQQFEWLADELLESLQFRDRGHQSKPELPCGNLIRPLLRAVGPHTLSAVNRPRLKLCHRIGEPSLPLFRLRQYDERHELF
jgi:hypothetical protein